MKWPTFIPDSGTLRACELRRRLDALTLTLLSRLVEAPPAAIGRVLQVALAELGELLDFDRVTIFSATDEAHDLRVRHRWSAPGVPPLPLSRVHDAFPELVTRILSGRLVEVRRIADLRSQAPRDFQSLRALGLRSVLGLPLGLGGTVEGALALVSMSPARRWPANLAGELRTLAHAIAMGLHRDHALSAPTTAPAGALDRELVGLTGRQLEVLQLLGRGQTMKQIADHLEISPRTVAFHKARLKEVLGVATSADLIRKALRASALER